MLGLLINSVALGLLAAANVASAQTASTSGYVGYNLTLEGDQGSAIFSTDETDPDAGTTYPDPDVYLNATVHVTEIDLTVVSSPEDRDNEMGSDEDVGQSDR